MVLLIRCSKFPLTSISDAGALQNTVKTLDGPIRGLNFLRHLLGHGVDVLLVRYVDLNGSDVLDALVLLEGIFQVAASEDVVADLGKVESGGLAHARVAARDEDRSLDGLVLASAASEPANEMNAIVNLGQEKSLNYN